MVSSERDLVPGAFGYTINPANVSTGNTYNAKLGLDEFIGDCDMDFFTIDVAAGQRVSFDIDLPAGQSLDTYIRLFSVSAGVYINGGGTPLAADDNTRAPGESGFTGESYLSYTFENAGKYALVVSHYANRAALPMTLDGRTPAAQGAYSLTVSNVADTTPPTLLASGSNINTKTFVFTFSEDVGASLSAGILQLVNTTTGQTIPTSAISMQWFGNGSNSAAFTVTTPGPLADGRYVATLPKTLVHDAAGNTLATDARSPMSTLRGDANQDGVVGFADLLVLASNYGKSGRNFQSGNFDYDTAGNVNFADLLILAAQYGKSLPTTASAAVVTVSPSRSVFSSSRISDDVLN
ncbi:MAG: pre-peptidase C-terminal domain-containing protein [Tepidisphaeraceae bacterium]